MTGRYHAYIIDDDGDFKVRPAFAAVDRGNAKKETDVIRFGLRNLTSYTATVSFPTGDPCTPAFRRAHPRGIQVPRGGAKVIEVRGDQSGLLRYDVTIVQATPTRSAVKARGESTPGMIIDP